MPIIKNNGYSFAKQGTRRNKRAMEADKRQTKYDSLPTHKKLALAQSRPGNSAREVKRLTEKLADEEAAKKSPVKSKVESAVDPIVEDTSAKKISPKKRGNSKKKSTA